MNKNTLLYNKNYQNRNIATSNEFEDADGIVYVNLALSNTGTVDINAVVREVRSTEIIHNTADYFLAVARFSIPLYSVPLINFGNYITSGNTTSMSFTLYYDGTFSPQTFVDYIAPYSQSVAAPYQSPSFCYDYTEVLHMFNIALSTAFTNLPSKPVGALAPYFIFDNPTQRISLIVQDLYLYSNSIPIIIGFNYTLDPFFIGFTYVYQTLLTNSLTATNGMDFFFIIRNQYNNLYIPPSNSPYSGYTGSCYFLEQPFTEVTYWNALQSIFLLSNTIPSVPESSPLNALDINQYPAVNDNTKIILQDFIPDLSTPGSYSNIAIYTPGFSEFRLVNLTNSTPLKSIDIIINWVDTFGNIFPIILSQGQGIFIKLAFIPKKFYLYRGNK